MKDILAKNTTKEDIEGIKEDIKDLTQRLGSLKDHSIESLSEQIDDLSGAINTIKVKGIGIGRDNAAILINAARQHPIKMLLGAFSIGMLACCLIKK
jgi:hypothetical protein